MNQNLDKLRDKANSLVEKPGVYLMKDKSGKIIYVGKAKRLKHRVVSYFRKNKSHNEKVRKMVSLVDDFDYIICDSEFEALVLECSLIKQYSPKYNILLKDDKGYHYIKITKEPYPRIQAAMQKQNDGAVYLGPYLSQYSVKQSVENVNKLFKLPTCSRKFPQDFRKDRPCLNFHIHNCAAWCKGHTGEQEYNKLLNEAVDYLKKGSQESVEAMQREMEEAAESLDFERAAKLRDRIRAITRLLDNQKVLRSANKSQDFIGMKMSGQTACIAVLRFRAGVLHDKADFTFYDVYDMESLIPQFISQYYLRGHDVPKIISLESEFPDMSLYEEYLSQNTGYKVAFTIPQRGEQKKLVDMAQNNALEQLSLKLGRKSKEITALEQLGKLLGLPKEPVYIESYDISNIGNDYMVGGMVVFENAKPKKSAYKKFNMKENKTQDDYACMSEMLRRRFSRYLDESCTDEGFNRLPDLILLDGGKGHVSVITKLLREMQVDVPVFGMVKDSRHRTRAITQDDSEIQISGVQSAFRLVTQIQDEVHRFAISFQRTKHKQNTFTLGLTSVPGIGEKKAFTLMRTFKTQKAMKGATVEELRAAAKVSRATAQALCDRLHEDG